MNKVEIMKKRKDMMKKFDSFPKTLSEMRQFIELKQLSHNYEEKNNALLESIIVKVNNNQPLSNQEFDFIHRIVDLGDTCGCDSDHRIRTYEKISEDERFAYTDV